MLDFLSRILGKESASSKNVAKERLRLVLVHDRASISPHMLNQMRGDIIKVISKYMEIDESAMEVNLSQDERDVALVVNIPVTKMKRDYSGKGQGVHS